MLRAASLFAPIAWSLSAGSQQEAPAPIEQAPKPAQQVTSEEPTETAATLDTLVIGATQGVPLRYPGGRDVIESETKETYPAGSWDAVVRRVPGVTVLPESGNDSRIHIGLRGNDPRRSALTTVMVDGIPVCEAPYGNTDIDG